MAASSAVRNLYLPLSKLSSSICGHSSKCYPGLQFVRHSRYAEEYVDPTISWEELDEPLAKDDPRKFQPIKAAVNEQTTSVCYDPILAKFVRMMIMRGHKEIARKCIDRSFEHIKLTQLKKYHQASNEEQQTAIEIDPMTIFHEAIENCKPLLITQRTRRGGITYTVPIPCTQSQQLFKSMRWIIDTCNEKSGGTTWFWEKLASELLAAADNQGKSVRKKQDLHRLCEANRAYAHYRW